MTVLSEKETKENVSPQEIRWDNWSNTEKAEALDFFFCLSFQW